MKVLISLLLLGLIVCDDTKDMVNIINHYNGFWSGIEECGFIRGGSILKADCVNQTFYDYMESDTISYVSYFNRTRANLKNITNFFYPVIAAGNQTWFHYNRSPVLCKRPNKINGYTYWILVSSVSYHVTTNTYQPTPGSFENLNEITWHIFVYRSDTSSEIGYVIESFSFRGGFWIVYPGFNTTEVSDWIRFNQGRFDHGWDRGYLFNAKRCTLRGNGLTFDTKFEEP